MAMPDICKDLAALLGTVERPGGFYASGRMELLAPRLEVDRGGQIALPLLPVPGRAADPTKLSDRSLIEL